MSGANSYRYLFEGDNPPFTKEMIIERYKQRFIMLQALMEKYGIGDECSINPKLLETAVLDYFADIARLKEFHGNIYIQRDKIYAYESYWLIKNHPIQISPTFTLNDEMIHINEYIVSYLYVKLLATELKRRIEADIQVDDLEKKLEYSKHTQELRLKLYYAFRHRTFTAQTLLLAFESYLAAAQFILQIT